jgi:hypothetical protein
MNNDDVKRIYADISANVHKLLIESTKHQSINQYINDAIALKYETDNKKSSDSITVLIDGKEVKDKAKKKTKEKQ